MNVNKLTEDDLELIIMNKSFCDNVRELVLSHNCSFQKATNIVSESKFPDRDLFFIGKLFDAGLNYSQIRIFVKAMNL